MNVHAAFESIDPHGSGCRRTCTTIHFDRFQQSIPRRARESMFTGSSRIEADSSVCCTWLMENTDRIYATESQENFNLNSRKINNINWLEVLIIKLQSIQTEVTNL